MSDSEMPDASQATNGAAAEDTNAETQVEQVPNLMDDGYKHFQRMRLLPGSNDTAASFEFTNEDHTLGNALRHLIMKNPDVEFCGYSIPHPADPKMNLRVQTFENTNVYDVLEKGLSDLADACDIVMEKFEDARSKKPHGAPVYQHAG